ncbi:MAG: hypothetical protein AAF170_15430 [Bacteroidota bacterium]
MGFSLVLSSARWIGLVAVAVLLSACESTLVGPADLSSTPPVAARFASDVQPLLTARCASCHASPADSGVDLSSYAALMASVGDQYDEAIVQAGDPGGSPLIDKLEASPRFGARMPLGDAPLTSEDLSTLQSWIRAGALDN